MELVKKVNKKLNVNVSLKLIEAVKNRPYIWNKRSQHNNNKYRLHHAWIAVASEVDLSVREAKLLWKNLLACFRVYKAKVKKSQQTGSANDQVYQPIWFAYTAMLFLSQGTDAVRTSDTIRSNTVVCKSFDEPTSKPSITLPRSIYRKPQTNKQEQQRKTNKKLNVDASIKLIEAVKKRPIIWSGRAQRKNHKNRFHDAWNAVASEVDLSVKEAINQWRALLCSFRVYKGKVKKSQQTCSGNDQVYQPSWFAYNAMLFLSERTDAVRTADTLPKHHDSSKEEVTDSEKVTLVNIRDNRVVCNSIDELVANSPETSLSTCPKPQTQVGDALQLDRRSQPWVKGPVRVLRTFPTQMEDPLQIKQTDQTPLGQVGPQANTFANRRILGNNPSLVKSFVNLIEHELSELPSDYATMAQVDIYKIIGEYKLKNVHRRSTQTPQSQAPKSTKSTTTNEQSPIKVEPSDSLGNNDMLEET